MAQKIHTAIYSSYGNVIGELKEADKLTDTELKFLSQYYRDHITQDTWLYTDIDDEILPLTNIDEKIMGRLSKIGEKG